MKKLFLLFKDKSIDTEKRLGAGFGVVAIIAILVEVWLSGFSLEGIVAGVKDMAGTIVAVAVFWFAIKSLIPKQSNETFDGVFSREMDRIIERYAPLIEKHPEKTHCYSLAANLKAIVNDTPGAYHNFFELKTKDMIELSLTKTVFVGKGGSDAVFEQLKGKLVASISKKISKCEIVRRCEEGNSSIKIFFNTALETPEQARDLASIIDTVMLTFVTENSRV